jgi:hypothetical protein
MPLFKINNPSSYPVYHTDNSTLYLPANVKNILSFERAETYEEVIGKYMIPQPFYQRIAEMTNLCCCKRRKTKVDVGSGVTSKNINGGGGQVLN